MTEPREYPTKWEFSHAEDDNLVYTRRTAEFTTEVKNIPPPDINDTPEPREEKCVWCGKTYEEHDAIRDKDAAVPKVPCLMMRSGFVARKEAALPKKEGEGWDLNTLAELYSKDGLMAIRAFIRQNFISRTAVEKMCCTTCKDRIELEYGEKPNK